MHVVLLLNRDLYCSVALNHLAPALAAHRLTVFLPGGVGRPPRVEGLDLLRLVEHDLPFEHVFPGLPGRGELLSFAELARRHDLAVERLDTPNDPAVLRRLRALAPDLVVSIRYGRILNAGFLALPRLGVLNLHSGLLPDYRGVMPTFRALLAGEPEIGCTLHWIDSPQVDAGPVVSEWRRPVDGAQSYFGHVLSLYAPGARLVLDAVARLERGEELETRPQRPGGAYFTFPGEDDLARFENRGLRLFRAGEYRELLRRYRGGDAGDAR